MGNERRSLVSELAGRGNVAGEGASSSGVERSSSQAQEVLEQIKKLEAQGFTFEGAEASVDLMLRRAHPGYVPPFELIDFMVLVERRRGRRRAGRGDRQGARRAEDHAHGRRGQRPGQRAGRGPAQGAARRLPAACASVKLVDYKVRILDSDTATAATVRVLIDTNCGAQRWSTVGASTNIIEASWRALADSMEYALVARRR